MKAIDVLKHLLAKAESETPEGHRLVELIVPVDIVREVISAQPEGRSGVFIPDITVKNLRKAPLEAVEELLVLGEMKDIVLPSAEPEQRYTEEELRVFQHGISLSLLSKRSAQHWHYKEDTATEIEFLERLYEKVRADMRGEQE